MDEATLLARIESRLTADADVERMVMARFEPAAEPGDLYTTRLLTALGGTGVATGEAFAHGSDYRVTLRRMDREQTSAVAQLLRASVEAAHEG
jgi:hypothetical protein